MRVPPLGLEDPLEEGMATHSRILAWGIPWTGQPGGLHSIGSQSVGHERSNLACMHACHKTCHEGWYPNERLLPASCKRNHSNNFMVEWLRLCCLFLLIAACFACITRRQDETKEKEKKGESKNEIPKSEEMLVHDEINQMSISSK